MIGVVCRAGGSRMREAVVGKRSRRRVFVSGATAVGLVGGVTGPGVPAVAFSPNPHGGTSGGCWPNGPTHYKVTFVDQPGRVWASDFKAQVLQAMQAWEQVKDPATGQPLIYVEELTDPGATGPEVIEAKLKEPPRPDWTGSGACGSLRSLIELNVNLNNGTAEDWANGAQVAAHEFGHVFSMGHTGREASGSSPAPLMGTCSRDFLDTYDFRSAAIGRDDHAQLVNAGWAEQGRAASSFPESASVNPGFENFTEGWKAVGASLGTQMSGEGQWAVPGCGTPSTSRSRKPTRSRRSR